jgi:hypothetical protein
VAKFKIVRGKKSDGDKTAKPGSVRTGAKVEKVKAGKSTNEGAGRFIGRTSGLGVCKYQNQSIETNLKRKKTDEELAREWKNEFPNAKADYTADTVRSVRNLYNKGKHGQDDTPPRVRVPEYNEAGEALPFWGEKAEAAKAAKAEKSAPAKKGKVVVKKKNKK